MSIDWAMGRRGIMSKWKLGLNIEEKIAHKIQYAR